MHQINAFIMKGDRKFSEPGECRPSWQVFSFREKQPDKGGGGCDPGEPPWAGWPQADWRMWGEGWWTGGERVVLTRGQKGQRRCDLPGQSVGQAWGWGTNRKSSPSPVSLSSSASSLGPLSVSPVPSAWPQVLCPEFDVYSTAL